MSRRKYATRWNEINCQVQCYGCNVMQQGQQYIFGTWIDINYGGEMADDLVRLSNDTVKFSTPELEESIIGYKQKLSEL